MVFSVESNETDVWELLWASDMDTFVKSVLVEQNARIDIYLYKIVNCIVNYFIKDYLFHPL